MARPISSIVVVGGGTAGWLAAAVLNRALGSAVSVTLVESPRIGRIGVGEATVPPLRLLFGYLGMDEAEWMPKCGGTFKLGVKFVNWRTPAPGCSEHAYYHPFFTGPDLPGGATSLSQVNYWLRDWMAGDRRTFGEVTNPVQRLCELRKSPKPIPESGVTAPDVPYAYHFDAALIADYLRELAVGRGVTHVIGEITRVELDDRGFVSRLHLEDGAILGGELFIDCSGFRSLLLEGALGEPFVSCADMLLCDSAVALPASSDTSHPDPRPYTQANAVEHGWIWEIPLRHREGAGYVYCSRTIAPDAAEARLREFLGPRAHRDAPANHIRMRVGHHRRTWLRNVVAVGLSSCFVEPLESTTIYLIQRELAYLLQFFPDSDFDEVRQREFNRQIVAAFEDVRDFIVLHYCLTDRADTEFWRLVRQAPVPDTLRATLERFGEGLTSMEGAATRLFAVRSYAAILSGMGFAFRRSTPLVDLVNDAQARAVQRDLAASAERLAAELPGHGEFLRAQAAPKPHG